MAAEPDLERLYDEHAQALFAFLIHLTRNEEETREILQEVFVKLAREPGLLKGARDPRAFLVRLAHNLAIDMVRRRGTRARYEEHFGEGESPVVLPGPGDEAAFSSALSAALGRLPPEQRAVVHLKLWEGLTFAEIGETLGASPNTVASRYRYGLDKLRELLRPIYEEINERRR